MALPPVRMIPHALASLSTPCAREVRTLSRRLRLRHRQLRPLRLCRRRQRLKPLRLPSLRHVWLRQLWLAVCPGASAGCPGTYNSGDHIM
jgi:hypothetical protein